VDWRARFGPEESASLEGAPPDLRLRFVIAARKVGGFVSAGSQGGKSWEEVGWRWDGMIKKYLRGLGLAQPCGLGCSMRFSLIWQGFGEEQGHDGESLIKL
jgi:hypothetical protein